MESSVDERFPLCFYYRIADQVVKQAKIYQDEGNTRDLYLTIERYSRLATDIIPQHRSFPKYSSKEKLRHQKILNEFIKDIKKLKALHGQRDCETDERTPRSPGPGENNLHSTPRRWEGTDQLFSSYKIGKVNFCSTTEMEAQQIGSSFPREDTKLTSGIAEEKRTSSALFQDSSPKAFAAAKDLTVNVHEVRHFSPPVLSCTESLPLVGQVSYFTIPESRNEYLESSCKESSASKAIQDVHISGRLMEEFMELARDNTNKDLETCGILGAFLENQTFFITTLIIPKQQSSSSSCQAINEEEIYAIQDERSLFSAGWIHTHPSQTCFLSSIDLHTQYSYQVMLPEAVAIVMAPTDSTRSYGIFRITDPGGMTILKHCQEDGFHPHPETADGSPIYEICSNVYINPNLRFEIIDLRTSSA